MSSNWPGLNGISGTHWKDEGQYVNTSTFAKFPLTQLVTAANWPEGPGGVYWPKPHPYGDGKKGGPTTSRQAYIDTFVVVMKAYEDGYYKDIMDWNATPYTGKCGKTFLPIELLPAFGAFMAALGMSLIDPFEGAPRAINVGAAGVFGYTYGEAVMNNGIFGKSKPDAMKAPAEALGVFAGSALGGLFSMLSDQGEGLGTVVTLALSAAGYFAGPYIMPYIPLMGIATQLISSILGVIKWIQKEFWGVIEGILCGFGSPCGGKGRHIWDLASFAAAYVEHITLTKHPFWSHKKKTRLFNAIISDQKMWKLVIHHGIPKGITSSNVYAWSGPLYYMANCDSIKQRMEMKFTKKDINWVEYYQIFVDKVDAESEDAPLYTPVLSCSNIVDAAKKIGNLQQMVTFVVREYNSSACIIDKNSDQRVYLKFFNYLGQTPEIPPANEVFTNPSFYTLFPSLSEQGLIGSLLLQTNTKSVIRKWSAYNNLIAWMNKAPIGIRMFVKEIAEGINITPGTSFSFDDASDIVELLTINQGAFSMVNRTIKTRASSVLAGSKSARVQAITRFWSGMYIGPGSTIAHGWAEAQYMWVKGFPAWERQIAVASLFAITVPVGRQSEQGFKTDMDAWLQVNPDASNVIATWVQLGNNQGPFGRWGNMKLKPPSTYNWPKYDLDAVMKFNNNSTSILERASKIADLGYLSFEAKVIAQFWYYMGKSPGFTTYADDTLTRQEAYLKQMPAEDAPLWAKATLYAMNVPPWKQNYRIYRNDFAAWQSHQPMASFALVQKWTKMSAGVPPIGPVVPPTQKRPKSGTGAPIKWNQ